MCNDFKNISQEFRLKKINETRNYFLKEIDQNELISKKHKKVCTTLTLWTLSYFNFYNYWICFHFHFCFFDWSLIGKLCNSCRNEKNKSITIKKKKKHDKIALLAKFKLKSIEV